MLTFNRPRLNVELETNVYVVNVTHIHWGHGLSVWLLEATVTMLSLLVKRNLLRVVAHHVHS